MKRFLTIIFSILCVLGVFAQYTTSDDIIYKGALDERCIDLMGVPLEGPDSVFIPALKSIGMEQYSPEDSDPGDYYFRGEFYGIKTNFVVSTDEKSGLLSTVLVTSGPYRTFALFDRNYRYFLLKLQRHFGNFDAKGDGSLHLMMDKGYVKISNILHEDKSRTINVFYLNTTPYYKDAMSLGLKGNVQEIITENPVFEGQMEHFDQNGKNSITDIIDREYNATGYLVKAAMLEPSGQKSELKYEYDEEGNLRRRTLRNVSEQVRSVNEYTYNDDGEIKTQSQKVFDKNNECVLSINMKNNYTDHDDEGNWTRNEVKLMYWEKGRQARNMNVVQTRTISYWEEE